MKKRDYFLRVGILLLACLALLGATLLSGCGGIEKTPDMNAEAKDLDEFYKEYGIRLAGRVGGNIHSSTSEPFGSDATLHVVDVDTTREVITIPETLNGKPITAIEITSTDGVRDCGKLKKLVISKNITQIFINGMSDITLNGRPEWSLENIEVAAENPSYCSIDGIVYNKDATEFVWIPKGLRGSVTVPNTIVRMNFSEFSRCDSLEELIIPDSVEIDEMGSFLNCKSLKTLVIPCVPAETPGAFMNCESLENLTISGGKFNRLENSEALKRLILGDKVTLTENCSFPDSLEEIRLPSGITEISSSMFNGCKVLKNIEIPESVTKIGDSAFCGCEALESIVIPKGVTEVGWYAFNDCYSLETVRLNAEKIEEWGVSIFTAAGSHTDGITLIIGKDVKEILPGMFENFGRSENLEYGKLLRVEFEKGSACTSIGRNAFSYNRNLLSFTVGESVTDINEEAFMSCGKVVEVINRSALELNYQNSGGLYDEAHEGKFLHKGDSLLTKMDDYWIFDFETPWLVSYSGDATELTLPMSINNKAYEIGRDAFADNKDLKSVVISDGVTKIGSGAFFNCEALETVTIGKNVKLIEEGAFTNANAIKTVYYNAINCADLTKVRAFDGYVYSYRIFNDLSSGDAKLIVGAEVKSIPAYLLSRCGQFSEVILPENSVCEKIGIYAFSGTGFMRAIEESSGASYIGKILLRVGRSAEGEFIVREGTLGIAAGAFENCGDITSIVLPSSVKSIGDKAFDSCFALTTVNIPDGVKKIGDYTFGYCHKLTSVRLPDSVTEIGNCAFFDCASLVSVNIPAGVTEIKDGTFQHCKELVYITGGEGLVKVADNATVNCPKIALTEYGNIKYRFFTPVEPVNKNITYAIFKKGTTSIPARFFENCESLLSVYIPADVETIGDYAFYNVNVQIRVFDERAEREGGAWKIVFENGNMKYYLDMIYSDVRFGYLFNGAVLDTSGLVYLPSDGKIVGYVGNAAELTIPARLSDTQITSIAPYAFCLNTTLTKITVENGIENIGEYAFAYCTSLNTVILNGGTVLDIGAFYSCTALEKVDASMGTLTHIRPYAFGACTKLSDVKLSPTLLIINTNAFDGCTAMTELTIPASVQIIEVNAFSGLTALTSVSFEKQEWYVANVAGDTRLEVNCTDPAEAAELLCDTYVGWYWFEKGYGDTNTEA